jgi:hypothetical protein
MIVMNNLPHPPPNMHDEACYHMLRLRHSAKYSNDELEREFESMRATTWGGCDPFQCNDQLQDDIRVVHQFCNVSVKRG